MDQVCSYTIEVQGCARVEDINAKSPLTIRLLRAEPSSTAITIVTDQSGFIGIIRHLHARGFVLLASKRQPYNDL
jgi:hypothetical protein